MPAAEAAPPEPVLPEAALLDPKRNRRLEVVDPVSTVDLTGTGTVTRRIA